MPVVDGKQVAPCPKCEGEGSITGEDCAKCAGCGEVYVKGWTELCEDCNGTGKLVCYACLGRGIEETEDWYNE